MTWQYTRAENGNIALTAEIDLSTSEGYFVLALGFGNNPEEAAGNAVASLRDGFDKAKHDYIAGWQEWIKTHSSLEKSALSPRDLSRISLAVLRTHESKTAPGGLIASLSIPWGFSRGDNDLGGYHLVWSRDMVETAGALLAAGAHEDVRRVLSYLQATQQPDAMPLVWAHAEYLKLRRSLRDGQVFDLPPQTVKRYLTEKTVSPRMVWRFNHRIRWMPVGKILRIETLASAIIHWSADDWSTVRDATTHHAGLGIHLADLSTQALPEGRRVKFTFFWPDAGHWEGMDFTVQVGSLPKDKSDSAERLQTDEK